MNKLSFVLVLLLADLGMIWAAIGLICCIDKGNIIGSAFYSTILALSVVLSVLLIRDCSNYDGEF